MNGDIAGGQAVRVVGAGGFEQGEIIVREMECFAIQYLAKLCSTPTVAGISAFIGTPGVVKNGEDVLISGFGKFSVKEKQARRGRNPQTGEPMMLAPRKAVTFKSSVVLRGAMNRRGD